MSGFDETWLALRAAADARACSGASARLLAGVGTVDGDLRIVDLGAGSGNNAARLVPVLASLGADRQIWTLVDDDATLLERAVARLTAHDVEVRVERRDLALGVDRALVEGADLVCCSALLDLASREWIAALTDALRSADVPAFLSSLDIDGAVEWSPVDSFDGRAAAAFDLDMRREKGLGIAVAGDAPAVLAESLTYEGYDVRSEPTPWHLGAEEAALQRRYLEDVAAVAARIERPGEVEAWRERRAAWIDDGTSRLVVGHADTLGLLRSRSNSTSSPIE